MINMSRAPHGKSKSKKSVIICAGKGPPKLNVYKYRGII